MTVDAIKAAIEQLADADQRKLADWFEERAQDAWDVEMERDFSPGGRGDHLFATVKRQIEQGQFKPMDLENRGCNQD